MELQETPHVIKKRILYKNPDSPLYRHHIDPEDGLMLTFPHLSDAEILLLQRKGVIAPLGERDVKEREAATERLAKAEQAAIKEAEKLAAENEKLRAQQKKAAALKMKQAQKEEVNDGKDS